MEEVWKTIKILILLLLFTVISAYFIGFIFSEPSGNVAHIRIRGEIISDEGFFTTGISSPKLVNRINAANNDPRIEALLVEINSPGGTVIATREVADALGNVNKTTVCWMRDISTSGAYWIASKCDKIVANEFTITGGIGVTGSYLEFSELFEKYGIGYVRIVSADDKDMGTPFREPTQEDIETLQGMIDRIHEVFVEDVSLNRNLSLEEIEKISKGSIFLGEEAYDIGLVDVLGGKSESLEIIRYKTNITEINLLEYRDEVSILDLMVMSMSQHFSEFLTTRRININAI